MPTIAHAKKWSHAPGARGVYKSARQMQPKPASASTNATTYPRLSGSIGFSAPPTDGFCTRSMPSEHATISSACATSGKST